jgi:hypothetical protein
MGGLDRDGSFDAGPLMSALCGFAQSADREPSRTGSSQRGARHEVDRNAAKQTSGSREAVPPETKTLT